MKPSILAGLFAVVAAAVPDGAARAETWCVRDSGGVTAPICGFSSAQDCVRAAIVGPSGSICAPETAVAPAAPAGKQTGRRRPRQQADR